MIELHLIGYTADLDHLVLDIAGGEGGGRYRLLIDGDLFATLDQIRELRQADGKDVGPYEWVFVDEDEAAEEERSLPLEDEPTTVGAQGSVLADEPDLWDDDDLAVAAHEAWADDPLEPPGRVRLVSADEADGRRASATGQPATPEPRTDPVPEPEPEPGPQPQPEAEPRVDPGPERRADADPGPDREPEPAAERKTADDRARRAAQVASPSRVKDGHGSDATLSPAEIQGMLRAGRSPRSVAKAAGTDVAWVERWLAPIEAERRRIRERAQAQRLERPRLGRSREPLGVAVERNLRARGVAPDELSWDVGRRADGRWRITVRFTQRDRNRSATWTFDPEQEALSAASELARELGFVRPASRRRTGKGAGGRRG